MESSEGPFPHTMQFFKVVSPEYAQKLGSAAQDNPPMNLAELPENVQLTKVGKALLQRTPPPSSAWLSRIVQLKNVGRAQRASTPPPPNAVFLSIVQSVIVGDDSWQPIPPPVAVTAMLSLIVHAFRTAEERKQ